MDTVLSTGIRVFYQEGVIAKSVSYEFIRAEKSAIR